MVKSRVRRLQLTLPLRGTSRTRRDLDTPLYSGAVGCNPCVYLDLEFAAH